MISCILGQSLVVSHDNRRCRHSPRMSLMNSDPQPAPPTVPTLERQNVIELVAYAEQYVLLLEWEEREQRRLSRDS